MARLCSFEIVYKDQYFPTLVSVRDTDQEVVCTVHFIERKIRYLEPGDVLVYSRDQGLKQPQHLPQELNDELSRCIAEWVLRPAPQRA